MTDRKTIALFIEYHIMNLRRCCGMGLMLALDWGCLALASYMCSPTLAAHEPSGAAETGFRTVRCEGKYAQHLQGICTNEKDAIYWSFTDSLVKTDHAGRVITTVPVSNHHGDLCFHEGEIFVAVNLGKFNEPAGQADSWIYVYDSESLRELSRHRIPEVVHGAGGVARLAGSFFVVGGLPAGVNENFVYEYDASFSFKARHSVASGYTLKGIQTIEFASGSWWFGCYGEPRTLLKCDRAFKSVERWEFDCSMGIARISGKQFLIGKSFKEPDGRYRGHVDVAVPDDTTGLRFVTPAGSVPEMPASN